MSIMEVRGIWSITSAQKGRYEATLTNVASRIYPSFHPGIMLVMERIPVLVRGERPKHGGKPRITARKVSCITKWTVST